MNYKRPVQGLFAACLLLGVNVAGAHAQPTAAQVLAVRPHVSDVAYATPDFKDLPACKVEAVRGPKGNSIGWAVVDGDGKTLRRIVDANGSGKWNLWCFYKDGIEVYREIDSRTPGIGVPDQFRWINDGGMKWGLDTTGKGKIDGWRMISSEEVAQEAFQSVAARDYERFRTLLIAEAELRSLKLSQNVTDRIRTQLAKAPAKFLDTANRMKAGAVFVQVEPAVPGCVPGDSVGMDSDLIHHRSRTVLYETGGPAGKLHEFMRTGEMLKVGMAWRMVDAPGEMDITGGGVGDPPVITKKGQEYLDEIAKVEASGPLSPRPTTASEVSRHMRHAALIEKLLVVVEPKERENWIEQMLDNLGAVAFKEKADSLAAAVLVKEGPATIRLGQLRNQLAKGMPGSNLAGHAAFVEMCARYLPLLENAQAMGALKKVQEDWHDALTKFVTDYPNVKDTPEALNYLAMGAEFNGRDEEAKRWYGEIATKFPTHPLAEKAVGSGSRLSLVGQPMKLISPTLDGKSNFNVASLKGKVVAVYYWASFCEVCPREFSELKRLHGLYHSQGFELVCVNLDDTAAKANAFLTANPLPGNHLFQPGPGGNTGLNGPLAVRYGINSLPTLFLIGRNGNVVSTTLQAYYLEDAIKKQL